MAIIELESVHFRRGTQIIFDDLTLQVEANSVNALMGPSGIGKTTLLQLMTAQLKPDAGVVRIFGEDINALSRRALFELRKKIGILFQHGGLLGDLNIFENIALPLRENTALSERVIRNLVLMKLEVVGLRGVCFNYPSDLSGGMARRISLARALTMDPEILFFDEPFTGQDPINMGILMHLIASCSENMDVTAVVVSHDVNEVLSISGYAWLIAEHKVIAKGTPEELKKSEVPHVRQFVEGLDEGPLRFQKEAEKTYAEDLT